MMPISAHFLIGAGGLAAFWAGGMISANEFAKLAVLMALFIYGLAGSIATWTRSPAWLGRIARLTWLLFFADAAVRGFLRAYFGMRPGPGMVLQAVLNTNPGETMEFFSQQWRSIGISAASLLLSMAAALWLQKLLQKRRQARPDAQRRPQPLQPSRASRIGVSVMLVLLVAIHFNKTMAKENPVLFWPLRYQAHMQELREMTALRQQLAEQRSQPAEWAVRYHGEDQRTVIWVLGESTNRNNMSLYGYGRETTPLLDAMRGDLTVLGDVVSSASATMGSLMNMLTPASLQQPNGWQIKPDVLQLARAAGYKTFWLSNQAANDGWLGLVAEQADLLRYINNGEGRGENNLDGALLPHVDAALADPAPKKLIVVHLLGAHPTYDMRYPEQFARFDDREDSVAAALKAAGRSFWIREQRDEYDNAILYGDYVLSEIIRRASTATAGKPAALLYSSDHGQEVGHFRNHAGQSPVENSGYEIPMVLWESPVGAIVSPGLRSAMQGRPYQTDYLDHTMLGLMKVTSTYYQPEHDVFSPQFRPQPRLIRDRPYQVATPACAQPPCLAVR
ncbi:phosphoethanolamine transferase [Noviherbaspirillum suwonense]|uniref:Heptose-I-phosphate ethanolaminephosphotransferase n=1 Tax=Noviherbaspirillum suwonense TaxID=1224511 RepID=A0ABY1QQC6_9BURK|nr:phosphoethanolamine transferase [Noviherbaspirillum suwonense]SMP75849.1 heptose-I-phosphate ethanolaminephosphotransferase [Noviherbaspirillum suwonense]